MLSEHTTVVPQTLPRGTGKNRTHPKDRGAVQGVVGPIECSLAFEVVAAETRLSLAEQQLQGCVPEMGAAPDEDVRRLETELGAR